MPLVKLNICKEYLRKDISLQNIALETIKLTHEILHKDPSVTVIEINDVYSKNMFVGNELKTSVFNISINITANTNSQREKELWIKSINHFLNACFIKNPTELVNYLSIFENQADMWGYNGITQSSRKIGLINDNAL